MGLKSVVSHLTSKVPVMVFNVECGNDWVTKEVGRWECEVKVSHYNDVIISVLASLVTGLSSIYSTVCSGADQRKHQSSASLVLVRGIHRWQTSRECHGTPMMINWYWFSFNSLTSSDLNLCWASSMIPQWRHKGQNHLDKSLNIANQIK